MYSKYTFFNKIVYSRYTKFHLHEGIDLTTGEARSRRVTGEVGAGDAVGPDLVAHRPSLLRLRVRLVLVPALPRHQGLGHSCDAIAVTGIPRSPEGRLLKDDRRDAQRLPSEMTKVDSKLKTVYVLTTRVESLGDLTRARYDAVAALRRSKQLV